MTAPNAPPIGSRTDFQPLPGGGYVYVLVDEAVRIELRYLRRESRQLHAEVDVRRTRPIDELCGSVEYFLTRTNQQGKAVCAATGAVRVARQPVGEGGARTSE